MQLIKWKNNTIEISPEAYCIKAFRNIWNADRSKYKEKAILILGTLYFMYHPASDFQHILDDEERLIDIKEQTGLDNKWKPDKLFEEAKEVYIKYTCTTSSLLLKDNKIMVEKIRAYCSELDLKKDVDDKGKPIHTLQSLTKSISDLNKLAVDITKAEKQIYQEIEEQEVKMRGKGAKKIADDGFDFMDE